MKGDENLLIVKDIKELIVTVPLIIKLRLKPKCVKNFANCIENMKYRIASISKKIKILII